MPNVQFSENYFHWPAACTCPLCCPEKWAINASRALPSEIQPVDTSTMHMTCGTLERGGVLHVFLDGKAVCRCGASERIL